MACCGGSIQSNYYNSAPKVAFRNGCGHTPLWIDRELDLVAVFRWIDNTQINELIGLTMQAIKPASRHRAVSGIAIRGARQRVTLMALMTSLVALSIDAMLPVMGDIARELDVADMNDRQLVISALFLGMVFGQFIYGPGPRRGSQRPSRGRLPAVYGQSLVAAFADSSQRCCWDESCKASARQGRVS